MSVCAGTIGFTHLWTAPCALYLSLPPQAKEKGGELEAALKEQARLQGELEEQRQAGKRSAQEASQVSDEALCLLGVVGESHGWRHSFRPPYTSVLLRLPLPIH